MKGGYDIDILKPGVITSDVELTRALRSFANTYNGLEDKSWSFSMPDFNGNARDYVDEENTFADTVRRAEALFTTLSAGFVNNVLKRMKGETRRPSYSLHRDRDERIREMPLEALAGAEAMGNAELPEEIYIALCTEFDRTDISEFADKILQPTVLEKLRHLDKMGPHLGKAVIGYSALHSSHEDVAYVAEHVLDLSKLGRARPMFKELMGVGRYSDRTAQRLKALLPEGINYRGLSKNGKKAVRNVGFSVPINLIDTAHAVLRENQERLNDISEEAAGAVPRVSKGFYPVEPLSPEEAREKYEMWLGVKKPEVVEEVEVPA